MATVGGFKRIGIVPSSKQMIDIVLSKTQRKTPTVVHKHYQITRIRKFYMRKIKFCQQTIHDRLHQLLTEFPKLDELHPFYADLMNVLYDRDHYKLALGQLAVAKQLVDGISRDYVRLLKFGDSLYRCKQLKRAAFGRYVTILRKQKDAFEYLEQVRQHLVRMPSIDPASGRTLLLCGAPNVGKSSFINQLTRADVEVQPYPFTTKSLYVGHMDYAYLRWQVIDTPGLLDQPLEERNTIEMQAVTALAHLRSDVIYMLDISEQCGQSIEQQLSLFNSLRPLFLNKPLILVANKTDVLALESLDPEKRHAIDAALEDFKKEQLASLSQDQTLPSPVLMTAATLSGEGVMAIRGKACDDLLALRVEAKLSKLLQATPAASHLGSLPTGLHIALPKPRDSMSRPPVNCPVKTDQEMDMNEDHESSAKQSRKRTLERDIERQMGWEYSLDLQKNYLLANEDEKYDEIPEVIDGHNIADFMDSDILEKLKVLEKEEAERELSGFYDIEPYGTKVTSDQRRLARRIREKRKLIVLENREKRLRNRRPQIGRQGKTVKLGRMERELGDLGVEVVADANTNVGRARSRGSKAQQHAARAASAANRMDVDSKKPKLAAKRGPSRDVSGMRDVKMITKAKKMRTTMQRHRKMRLVGRKGEADRHIFTERPRHLFAGKRGAGKTDRR